MTAGWGSPARGRAVPTRRATPEPGERPRERELRLVADPVGDGAYRVVGLAQVPGGKLGFFKALAEDLRIRPGFRLDTKGFTPRVSRFELQLTQYLR